MIGKKALVGRIMTIVALVIIALGLLRAGGGALILISGALLFVALMLAANTLYLLGEREAKDNSGVN